MSRKILKILISILFLIVAAVAAVLGIKSFFPELMGTEIKYGVKPTQQIPTHKTPAFKKDEQEQKPRVTIPPTNERKYGVAPIQRPPYREDMTDKYGVVPVGIEPLFEPIQDNKKTNNN